jgi:hypothetical protein
MDSQSFLLLDKANPMAWAFMPYALERIKRFIVKYRTDTDPDVLASLIQQHFVMDEPLLKVAVGYQKGKGVFAHALACIDDITGTRFLTIMQLESDILFEDRKEVIKILDGFEAWGRKYGAKEVRLVTMDRKHVRMFERYYGFKEQHRIAMHKALSEA